MERLSEEQIEEYRAAFYLFDRDNNGYITTKELGSIMRTLGFNPNEEDLQQMIFTVDYDGDGMLNFEEYIQLMEEQKTPQETEEDIVQAFRVFDSDNKGYIESADLRELLEKMEWKVYAEDLKDLITSANLHQDRRIGLEEFAMLVAPDGLPPPTEEGNNNEDDEETVQ